MIRLAKKSDLKEILAITKACASKMITEDIYQWNESYPDLATFEEDIKQESLYVYEEENKILGCVVISSEMDSEYQNVDWLTLNEENYYIHRLAVHPTYQGRGIAKKMMHFAQEQAKKNQKISIRLDTFSGIKYLKTLSLHPNFFYDAANSNNKDFYF